MNSCYKEICEKLNPVLIKEIIRGMRTRFFVASFIITQLILLTATLSTIIIGNLENALTINFNKETIHGVFWAGISLPFLTIIPWRAVTTISEEVMDDTIEMLLLSNLSVKQIVFGKFFSHAIQILMLASTILPYAIIRYFAGEVDILQELITFAAIISVSLMTCAAAVTISSYTLKNRLTHMLRVVTFVIFSLIFTSSFATAIQVIISKQTSDLLSLEFLCLFGLYALSCLLIIHLMLITAAGNIAPPDENLWPIKRINCMAQAILVSISLFLKGEQLLVTLAIISMILVAMEGLMTSENTNSCAFRKSFANRKLEAIFSPLQVSAAIWFNTTFFWLFGLFALRHNGMSSILSLGLPAIYLILSQYIVNTKSQEKSALLIWAIFIPCCLAFCITTDSRIQRTASILAFYGTISAPYAFIRATEIANDKRVRFLFQILIYGGCFIGFSIAEVLFGDIAFSPLGLLKVSRKLEFISNGFIAISILFFTIMALWSSTIPSIHNLIDLRQAFLKKENQYAS